MLALISNISVKVNTSTNTYHLCENYVVLYTTIVLNCQDTYASENAHYVRVARMWLMPLVTSATETSLIHLPSTT